MDYYRNSEKRVLNNAGYYLNGQTRCIFKSYNNATIKNVFKKTITQQQEVYLKLYFTSHLQFYLKSKEKILCQCILLETPTRYLDAT